MLNSVKTAVPETQAPHSSTTAVTDKAYLPDERWEILISITFFAVVTMGVFAPWLFCGKAFYWGDIGLFFLPLNHFLKNSISSGSIPLWNPYLFCGAPFVGNPQVSLLYPSTLLLPIFPAVTAIMISEAAHIFAAGFFFWLFARKGSFRLGYYPSLLAATVYMLGGYYVAKAQFPNMLAALTYVPLLLYETELIVLRPSGRRAAAFGAALGMQLLAAHTQISVFTVYLIAPYGLLVYYSSQDRKPFFRVLGMVVAGGCLAAGLACAYWLPVAELIHSSARQALTLRIANRFYLPTYEVGNFILPHLFGTPFRGNWHAHGNYWETDNYVGIIPFALAIYGVFELYSSRHKPDSRRIQFIFWSVTFLVSLWLSFGADSGLYDIAFYILPALKAFHDPARLMLGANVALALFAGAGLQFVHRKTSNRYVPAIFMAILALSIVDLGWHDRTIYPLKPVGEIEDMSSAPVAKLLIAKETGPGAGRILMPDSAKTWQSFTTYKSYERSDPSFLREWPDTLSPCLGMTFGLREAGGYDPEYRKDSQELVGYAENLLTPQQLKPYRREPSIPASLSEYLSMLGVQYLVTYRVKPVEAPGLISVYRSHWQRRLRLVTVYQNTDYRSRAAVYGAWTRVDDQDAVIADLASRLNSQARAAALDKPFVPIVEMLADSGSSATTPLPGPVVPAQFVVDQPDRVELETPADKSASLLILADTLHPGWSAALDGRPTHIYRTNGDQRAIYIPGSPKSIRHVVNFYYRPADFFVGFYVSLVSMAVILCLFTGAKENTPAKTGRHET